MNRNKRLIYDIFFWEGKNSSHDEKGLVALKAVELGDALGGTAPQHREVQGHESNSFLSLFRDGFQIVEGGIESGFRKVDNEGFETRLLHVKGVRNARITRVELSAKSLNHGDVFILDCGKTLYLWTGKEASYKEKIKGAEACRSIRDKDKNGKAGII